MVTQIIIRIKIFGLIGLLKCGLWLFCDSKFKKIKNYLLFFLHITIHYNKVCYNWLFPDSILEWSLMKFGTVLVTDELYIIVFAAVNINLRYIFFLPIANCICFILLITYLNYFVSDKTDKKKMTQCHQKILDKPWIGILLYRYTYYNTII